MLTTTRLIPRAAARQMLKSTARPLATASSAAAKPSKKEGDISSVFVSLSGQAAEPLPPRFTEIKRNLIAGNEAALEQSWKRLLTKLSSETENIARQGPSIVPQIAFSDLKNPDSGFLDAVKERGVAVIKGVVPESEARSYKFDVEAYVRANPWTKAFPPHDPQVFELYWSPSQVQARAHPNMIAAQQALMKLWHSNDGDALISTSRPLSYADRVRIRHPGDSGFALGPHVDGGSVERWEPEGYGRGGVYDEVFRGSWETYNPWESSSRLPAVSDLYDGAGACSMFRMFQGWLSMCHTGPNQGTLLVNPMLQLSTAYFLLRPFFEPKKPADGLVTGEYSAEFLQPENWRLKQEVDSELNGATPGHGQELSHVLHPHLDLRRTMVHIPEIKPGDYVVWHCDTIHAVDKVHMGKTDSSVMYIPVCPTTESNARYLARQRDTFLAGFPGPDFPGGKGESEHFGRPTVNYMNTHMETDGLQAMGLQKLTTGDADQSAGASTVIQRANAILGFE